MNLPFVKTILNADIILNTVTPVLNTGNYILITIQLNFRYGKLILIDYDHQVNVDS